MSLPGSLPLRGSVFLTTSITEIGFVRIAASVPTYSLTVLEARQHLVAMKANAAQPLTFVTDGVEISDLPAWVSTPNQTTAGHLSQLAAANQALLATLDKTIPNTFQTP